MYNWIVTVKLHRLEQRSWLLDAVRQHRFWWRQIDYSAVTNSYTLCFSHSVPEKITLLLLGCDAEILSVDDLIGPVDYSEMYAHSVNDPSNIVRAVPKTLNWE